MNSSELPPNVVKAVKEAVSSLIWVKLVSVGNTGVGKTCLIKHFCESKFTTSYQATVGADYGFKIAPILGADLRVHLWDLSGHPDYFEVRNELYDNAHGCFLVFDVTNRASFESLDSWMRELGRCGISENSIVLVGNKIDMRSKRVVTTNEAKKWAHSCKIKYYETSVMSGEGVQKMFNELLSQVSARLIPRPQKQVVTR